MKKKVEISMLSPSGELTRVVLGTDYRLGHTPQAVVPAGCWFGAKLLPDSDYCFFSCTVSPGFAFDDFEIADASVQEALIAAYPHAEDMIRDLALASTM